MGHCTLIGLRPSVQIYCLAALEIATVFLAFLWNPLACLSGCCNEYPIVRLLASCLAVTVRSLHAAGQHVPCNVAGPVKLGLKHIFCRNRHSPVGSVRSVSTRKLVELAQTQGQTTHVHSSNAGNSFAPAWSCVEEQVARCLVPTCMYLWTLWTRLCPDATLRTPFASAPAQTVHSEFSRAPDCEGMATWLVRLCCMPTTAFGLPSHACKALPSSF